MKPEVRHVGGDILGETSQGEMLRKRCHGRDVAGGETSPEETLHERCHGR